MRIVDRATLTAMPAGTVFQRYEPIAFGGLEISGGRFGRDDLLSLTFDQPVETTGIDETLSRLEAMVETGASFPVSFDDWAREGATSPDQLFAVWEEADLAALGERIAAARTALATARAEASWTVIVAVDAEGDGTRAEASMTLPTLDPEGPVNGSVAHPVKAIAAAMPSLAGMEPHLVNGIMGCVALLWARTSGQPADGRVEASTRIAWTPGHRLQVSVVKDGSAAR